MRLWVHLTPTDVGQILTRVISVLSYNFWCLCAEWAVFSTKESRLSLMWSVRLQKLFEVAIWPESTCKLWLNRQAVLYNLSMIQYCNQTNPCGQLYILSVKFVFCFFLCQTWTRWSLEPSLCVIFLNEFSHLRPALWQISFRYIWSVLRFYFLIHILLPLCVFTQISPVRHKCWLVTQTISPGHLVARADMTAEQPVFNVLCAIW